jgi:hypothetical protein
VAASSDPESLLALVENGLSDAERLLILAEFSRPLWVIPRSMADTVTWAMNRMELALYREREPVSIERTSALMELLIREAEVEIERQANHERAIRREGDWYWAWEIGNEIKHRQMEISAIHVMLQVGQWARNTDRAQFVHLVRQLPERLTRIYLHRPDPLPERLRATRPWELPWELFVHLEGGIDDRPSIWNQVMAGCKAMMCNTIREIIASPFTQFPIERSWLSAEVVHLCYTMRRTGNYDQMDRVGELLDDQGCADTNILLHCLRGGHHRGCWLVDAIIGRRLHRYEEPEIENYVPSGDA